MLFHGLPASAMYYRDQLVSSLYWRGFRIWQAQSESGPLRKGLLRIAGQAAAFRITGQILPKGNLNLVRKTAGFSTIVSLSRGNLHITGHALSTTASAVLAKGTLNLHGSVFAAKFRATLANRVLNLTGKAATFSLNTVTPVPSYSNPGGTGNRAGVVTVTTNLSLGGGAIGNIVDGSQANSAWLTNNQSSGYIQFDFGTAQVISEIKWYQDSSANNGSWGWDGSIDASDWIPIDDPIVLGSSTTQTVARAYNPAKGYRYYRLILLPGTATSSGPYVREIEFKLDVATSAGSAVSSVPDYRNSEGRGNRTSAITVTASFAPSSGSTLNNLVDGAFAQNSSDSLEIPAGQSNQTITFDFGSGVSKLITGYTWWQSNATNHGNWKMRASNDNATWTDTSAAEMLGGTTRHTSKLGAANTTKYRYYQLFQTSGSTTSSPWNLEIEFEIAA